MAAVRRHLLSVTASDFASSIFATNANIDSIEITISRDNIPTGSPAIDVSHNSSNGFPIEGYSL